MFEGRQSSQWLRKLRRRLLDLDAMIDAAMFRSGQNSREAYAQFRVFMDRFHLSGWKNLMLQGFCGGLNLACALSVLVLIFAMPAFQLTSEDWLKKQELAVVFQDRYGTEVGRRGILHDDSVPIEQYPDDLIHAVLATEDRRFYDHFGIDVIGTLRALTVNARANGAVVQGGSSITQQLAKNLFLNNKRSLERKVTEAYLALWLEHHLSKRQILQLYLDRAYMGGGTFGVQAAAQFYFGKSVRDVSLAESAMLAGLFKAPTKYAPHANLPAARARANDVLNNMVAAGYLTQGQIYAAKVNPAAPIDRDSASSPDWYLDWAFDEIKRMADEGKFGQDRVLTARLALDSSLQKKAEQAIESALITAGPSYHAKQSAIVVMEPEGAVRAIVGGRDYGISQFNRATDALRQPGSSFKPFVYFTALLTGRYKPTTMVTDSPVCIGDWCPHNYGGSYAGTLPLASALARSLNTVAVKLSIGIGEDTRVNGKTNVVREARAGRDRIVATARKMGLTSPLADTVSLPIGSDEVSVIEMASAYATFANGGKRAPAYAVVEVKNSHHDVIYRRDLDEGPLKQIFDPATIALMNSMLVKVVEEGTARNAQLGPIRVAGKTGTTNSYKDAWFVGFSGNYVGAIWFGNDDDSPMNNMTGGTLPAATWHEIMAFAHNGIDLKPLFGLGPAEGGAQAANANKGPAAALEMGSNPRSQLQLSSRSAAALVQLGRSYHQASTALALGQPDNANGENILGTSSGRFSNSPVSIR